MNPRLIVRPEAEADIAEAAVWYESREPGLGLNLLSEVRSAIARAFKSPESFTRVRAKSNGSSYFSRGGFPIGFSLLLGPTQ
jgi:plasmid stabilization system protein ParE